MTRHRMDTITSGSSPSTIVIIEPPLDGEPAMYNSDQVTTFSSRRRGPWIFLATLAEMLRGWSEQKVSYIPGQDHSQLVTSVPPLADHLRDLMYGDGMLIKLSRVALAAHAIGRSDAVTELNHACNHMRRALELLGEDT